MEGKPSTTLAVTSLVLGIASVAGFCLLTGIPAIITGHIARSRVKRDPYRYSGGGMALTGLILGYASVVIVPAFIVFSYMMSEFEGGLETRLADAKARAQAINCISNMKQIGLAARMWSLDHDKMLPPDFASMSKELEDPKYLVCPSDTEVSKARNWSDLSQENISYEFLHPGLNEPEARNVVIFRCPIHDHEALGDGTVREKPVSSN